MKNFVSLIRIPFILLQTDYNALSSAPVANTSRFQSFLQFNFRKIKRFFKNSPYLPFIIVILFITLVAFFAIKGILLKPAQTTASNTRPTNQQVAIDKPIAQQTLEKQFTFPLKDQSGKVVSNLMYDIQSVELRNQIVVKGQKATAIQGRTFLIINLKITNNYDKTIQINARDYIRLIINGSTEKFAPDIHNDPVEVQAISTKYTRVGIAIDDATRNVVLQVGEITGKKSLIKLDL